MHFCKLSEPQLQILPGVVSWGEANGVGQSLECGDISGVNVSVLEVSPLLALIVELWAQISSTSSALADSS